MIVGLAIATLPRALHAQLRVDLIARPPGAEAERLERRTAELVQQAGAQPELREDGDVPEGAPAPPLARVTLELDRANARLRVAITTESDALVRDIALPHGVLDETALEEAAQIVASTVSALVAGATLPKREPTDEGAEPETAELDAAMPESRPAAAHTAVARETPSLEARASPPPATSETRDASTPRTTSARPTSIRAPRPALREPVVEETDDSADARQVGNLLAATLGYSVELFGVDTWLHGPELALAYARPFSFGSIGARLDVWFATTTRLQAQLIDAKASAQALRLFALYEPWPVALIGLELGAGFGARVTTLEGIDANDGTAPSESSLTSWAVELYCGARLRTGMLLATLGFGFEFDPVAADYGLQYGDQFATTHTSSHVRPAVRAHVGLAF